MGRRKQLPGSLEHKPAGPKAPERWRFKARNGTDPVTGKPVWDTQTFYDLNEAIEYDAAHTRKTVRGALTGRSPRFTVNEAIDEWADALTQDDNTIATYQGALQPIRAGFGTQPVRKLHRTELSKVAIGLLHGTCTLKTATGRTRSSWGAARINSMLSLLEDVLDMLRHDGFLDTNQAALTPRVRDISQLRATADEIPAPQVYTVEEIGIVLAGALARKAVQGLTVFAVCLLALLGLRKGEIAGLRWDMINFETGRMWVSEQRKPNNKPKTKRAPDEGAVRVDTTKTEESERELPVPPSGLAALKAVRRWQLEKHLASGGRFGKGAPPTHVVVNRSGLAVHPETVYDKWTDLVGALPVPYLNLHKARDTCATILALNGVLPHMVGAWLGHRPKASYGMTSASRVTEGYIHAAAQYRQVAADTWETALGAIVTSCDTKMPVAQKKRQVSA